MLPVVEADDARVDDRLAVRDGLAQFVGFGFLSLHPPQAEQDQENGGNSFHVEQVNPMRPVGLCQSPRKSISPLLNSGQSAEVRQNTCKRVLLAQPGLPIDLPVGGLISGPSGSVFSALPALRDIRSFDPYLAWIMLDPMMRSLVRSFHEQD
jgi:hypothetical protein